MDINYIEKCIKNHHEIFDSAITFITVISLLIAIIAAFRVETVQRKINRQFRNFNEISEQVNKQLKNTQEISENLSTRYVDNFPYNMEEITKLISNTKRKLIILSDVPAYGHYSNPEGFYKYKQAINDLLMPNRNINVVVIAGNQKIRRESRKIQYNNKSFDEIVTNIKYIKYFEIFPHIIPPKEKSIEGFFEWLDERNKHFEDEIKNNGALVLEVINEISSHVWLRDDAEAIFTFYNSFRDSNEVSFFTKDKRIIDLLITITKNSELNSKNYYS